LKYEARCDETPDNPLLTHIDVGNYCDNPLEGISKGPVLLYTYNPTQHLVTNHEEFNSFWKDGLLHTRIRGGGEYKEKVWDFDVEIVTVEEAGNIHVCEVTTLPHHVLNDPYHKMVVVECVAVVKAAYYFLPLSPLRRWCPRQCNSVNLMLVSGATPHYVLQRDGKLTQYEVPCEPFDMCADHATRTGVKCAPGSLKAILGKHDCEEATEIVHACLSSGLKDTTWGNVVVFSRTDCAEYSGVKGSPLNLEPIDKPKVYPFGPNLLGESTAVAANDSNNEKNTAAERNTLLHNKKRPGKIMDAYAKEFIGFMPRKLVPQDPEEVIAAQTRKAQIARNKQHADNPGKRKGLVTFMKTEPAMKGVARGITQTTVHHQLEYGAYCRPMSEAMHQFKWYMPGSTPAEIDEAVTNFVTSETLETDYSRFDARVSGWFVDVFRVIMTNAFGKKYTEHINELIDELSDQIVFGKHETSYNKGSATTSGAADTTLRNTVINAFISYCALRHMGLSVKGAFNRLGPKYGDDSLTNATADALNFVCKETGMVITIEEKRDYIGFLGRSYPIRGVSGSICDVPRFLAKSYFGYVDKGAAVLAVDKATGYLATDAHTPIVSQYCKWLLRRYGSEELKGNGSRDMDWRRETGPWPVPTEEAALSRVASMLDTSEDEVVRIMQLLDSDATPLELEGVLPGSNRHRDYNTVTVSA
jgi:hypothetical protein